MKYQSALAKAMTALPAAILSVASLGLLPSAEAQEETQRRGILCCYGGCTQCPGGVCNSCWVGTSVSDCYGVCLCFYDCDDCDMDCAC